MSRVGPAVGATLHKAAHVKGWMWLSGAVFITLLIPAYPKANALFFSAVVDAAIILWLIVGLDTGWYSIGGLKLTKTIGGYLLVYLGFAGLYQAGATVAQHRLWQSDSPSDENAVHTEFLNS